MIFVKFLVLFETDTFYYIGCQVNNILLLLCFMILSKYNLTFSGKKYKMPFWQDCVITLWQDCWLLPGLWKFRNVMLGMWYWKVTVLLCSFVKCQFYLKQANANLTMLVVSEIICYLCILCSFQSEFYFNIYLFFFFLETDAFQSGNILSLQYIDCCMNSGVSKIHIYSFHFLFCEMSSFISTRQMSIWQGFILFAFSKITCCFLCIL